MDTAVALIQAYLRVNGYFTVTEYPVIRVRRDGSYTEATDIDVLAFRFAGTSRILPGGRGSKLAPAALLDPHLHAPSTTDDMIIAEIKEGEAVLNRAARDPDILRAALMRFGCCPLSEADAIIGSLLSQGRATTPGGHGVRMVAFGRDPPVEPGPYTVVLLADVFEYLEEYMRIHWDVLSHARFRDPALGLLALREKANRAVNRRTGRA